MKRLLMILSVALGLVALPLNSFGQAVSGTLLGTVADTTGATVANAKVTATAVATSTSYESVTNSAGNYTIPNLPPGTYTVTVVAQGFKKVTNQNIDVLINSSTRVDFDVAPGSVSEEVMVTAAPPLLQTDRADISTKLESAQLQNLPMTTNRNFQSLLNLIPGSTPATFEHSQFFNAQGSLQTRVNGIPRMGNLYQIEGIDDDERTGLLQIIIPPADAIQSVDITTNNFDAELGRAIGAVTNVVLKSGTNKFHGSAFEYIQNNAVNARSYFGPPLGHLSYNNYGGSIGGPIFKDKLFFFGDYQGSSDHETVGGTFTIPDPRYYTPNAQGNIDLSSMLGAAGSGGIRQGQIFDPSTGDGRTVVQGGTPRTAFANNQIPIGRVNPVSLDILKRINAAAAQYGKLTPSASLLTPANNYTTTLPFTKGTNSWDTKIDYAMNERNHVSGRFSWQRVNTFQAPTFGAFLGGPFGGGFQGVGTQTSYSTGVNYDHVFSPTLFTEARFGVAHLRNNAQPSNYGSNDATTLGIPGVNINEFSSGQVGIFLTGFGQSGADNPLIGYSASVPWIRGESNIDFVNNWTKIIRNHTIKFGGDLRRVRDDLLQDQTFSPRGIFRFADQQTSDATSTGTNLGNNIASFLLDRPSQVGRDVNTFFPAYRQWWFFAFVSDKWQVTPKLTLDLGVRWELYPPATPKIPSGFTNYDPVNNNLVIAGIGNNPSNLGMQTRYRYWAPRTGFAYRATDNTVVRGGFGVSYMPYADNNYAYNYPVRSNNAYNPTGASPYTAAVLADGSTVATFQAGFPAPVAVPIPANGIIPVTTATLAAQNLFYVPLDYKNPYVASWNVAVQQALPYDMSLQVAYVANHGTGIPSNIDINNPADIYGGGNASKPQYNCVGCVTTGPNQVHRTAATNKIFQGFSSNYQSLQLQLTKRFAKGLGFNSAFTWGKGLGYVTGDDGNVIFLTTANLRRNYAPNDFDRKLNFEQSFTYELPVGRGHQYLNSGVGAFVLGGWKLAGTISAVSGLPFSVYANGGTLNTPGTAQLANLSGVYKVLGGLGPNNPWLDVSAFSQPGGCPTTGCNASNVQLGNTGRNQFRGPGFIQNNFSIFKSFSIWREAALETRFDAFQLSNTPQFAVPNSGSGNLFTSGSFGRITNTLGSGQGSVNGVGGGRSLQASARITF